MQAESTAIADASLTLAEVDALAGHEATIERHLDTFVAVGEALLAIRDGRLYRASHGTFEDYCRERWGFTDRRGRQLMAAAESVAALPAGTTVPATESVARELAPLRDEPERLREAWETAVEQHGPEPTAAEVREIVKPTIAPSPEPIPGQTSFPAKEDTDLGREAESALEVRQQRAMTTFMQAAEKTATLAPQLKHIVEGVLAVDAEQARAEAARALDTWTRVNALLAERSTLRLAR
jgi:hypothetical protein